MALTSRHRWWHLGNGNHKIYIISASRTCIIRKLGWKTLWSCFKVAPSCLGRLVVRPFTRWSSVRRGKGGGEETGKERAELFPLSTKRRYIRPVQGSPLSWNIDVTHEHLSVLASKWGGELPTKIWLSGLVILHNVNFDTSLLRANAIWHLVWVESPLRWSHYFDIVSEESVYVRGVCK